MCINLAPSMKEPQTAEDIRRQELQTHRLILVIGSVLFPLMGITYLIEDPSAEVYLPFRFSFASALLALVYFSYRSERLRKHLWMFIYSVAYIGTIFVVYLLYKNNLSTLFILGLTVMMFSVSIIFRTPQHLALYFLSILTVTACTSFFVSSPEVNPVVPIVSISIVSLMGFVVTSFRLTLLRLLTKSSEEAQALVKLRGDFLANMSHEIRTPMNGVIGMTDLLLETKLDEEQKELAQTVQYSANSLLSIINDILDLSKFEAGKLELAPTVFSLQELIEQLERVLSIHIEKKNITFVSNLASGVPHSVIGDPHRLQQILINLIGNAIKFTPENGSISLNIINEESQSEALTLRFIVTDTGIGISEENQKAVFDAFTQADSTTTRKYGGTGLGLTIAANLVGLMGGEISVRSQPGLGTAMQFTANLLPTTEKEEQLRATVRVEEQLTRKLHILVAEDNVVNQRLIAKILQKAGHEVSVVDDGLQAVQYANEQSFDLILMDIQMPKMGGEQATQEIRSQEKDAHIPIIALTAHAMQGDKEKFLSVGLDGYVSKPIKREDLFREIEKVLL